MKLERINAFIDVAEQLSFAAAAKKQGKSAAAISSSVSLLETELGAQLFNRNTRKVELTQLGKQYYELIKKGLSVFEEANDFISGTKEAPQGRIKILANRLFSESLLFPHLPEFLQRYPKIKIDYEIAERVPYLEKENIDIAYGYGGLCPPADPPAELIQRRISDRRILFCASPKYLKENGTPEKPTDLAKHKYITHSMRKKGVILFKNHAPQQVCPSITLNDIHSIKECALLGLGVIKIQDDLVQKELKEGRLIEILKDQSDSVPVYIYYQAKRYVDPKIRAFIDFYLEKMQVK